MGLAAACIYDLNLGIQTPVGTQKEELRLAGVLAMIFVVPILATNVLSTSFIAWKAWYVVCLLVSVLFRSHDEYPSAPGIITEHWARISERVDLLGAWRKFSCF
jgi:hypothetical protein